MLGKKFIKELLGQMSLEEKAAEMTQLRAENTDSILMGILRGVHENSHLSANAGSLLGFSGAQQVLEAQRIHLEENAHHIPLLFMTDVIHGYRTVFPSVLGLSASWDPSLIEETASVAAAEASVAGIHVTFSPMADLVRDARWGRVTESSGEDPYLSSLFAAAFTRGYQGKGIDQPFQIASCVKHFIGYGAVEGGRDYDSVQLGDYQLYNDYLPAFNAAIDAGCELIMPAFNTLNGIPCTANKHLLQDILRGQLDFHGAIISDCTAVFELNAHGVSQNDAEAAALSINAGIDIEMVSSTFYDNLENLVKTGTVKIEDIDKSVERILTLKDKLGLFENPYKDADPDKEKELLLCPKHRKIARNAVSRSVVLLKNEQNILPLKKDDEVALIGPFANSKLLLDVWGRINADEEDCITLYEAMQDSNISYAQGCSLWNMRDRQEVHLPEDALIEKAASLALQKDKIVLVLGEHPEMSSEAGSRSELTLPENQMALFRALCATGKPIITVLITGRPLALTEIAAASEALLIGWFPGTEGGNGIADILTGHAFPSGRLPVSFPRSTGQVPLYYNHMPTGRPNYEKYYQPFTNGYADLASGPLYPFGYGLTYTSFSYSSVELTAKEVSCRDPELSESVLLTASVTLSNTGAVTGTETVQLYLQDVTGSYSRPIRMLKAFKKITLPAGESVKIDFPITAKMLEYYIPDKGITLEPGAFRVYIAPNADCISYKEFILYGGYSYPIK